MTTARTIMLVDDELDTLTVNTRALEMAGYAVQAFDSPESALDHITSGYKDCDIIVSDIMMPTMSGMELVKQIKKIRPEIKVILMTAFEIHINEFEIVQPSEKMYGLILKPFSISNLIKAIKLSEQMPNMGGTTAYDGRK